MRYSPDLFSLEEHIALTVALGTEHFFDVLEKTLSQHISFGSSSAICYNKNMPPKLLFSHLLEHEQNIFYARFLDGAYVASPAYQGFMNNYADGVYPWRNLMPEGFKESQMYLSYYQTSNITDLLYLFVNCGDIGFVQFCLGRHAPSASFNESEIHLIEAMSVFLLPLINKHWEFAVQKQALQIRPLSSIVSERVSYLLNNFEAELLTSRERQIAKLVITGHSSQSAADTLNISPGTERVHRAKLYAKLKLRSSSELFSYFLQQLTEL
ncbi:helix-turn-helix transcriptional regulator [uncultured Paraglaciecola sp.]|uniref:response regulator transcription factor n=1 Tax=uncultured Paraglaciecola sp. TaxID=1765024 RepID=UPI0030DA23E7